MGFENLNHREETLESLTNEGLSIAQAMSQKWNILPKDSSDIWSAENPDFGFIYSMTEKTGKRTGIQAWYDGQIDFIETRSDGSAQQTMMWRLVDTLKRHQKYMDEVLQHYV
ncbi:MAG: hypothetical protein ACI8V7_000708 [Candidatus Paceibacteria bacterium]|jgi:hypothetical protein